ncbi:GNAT family N-acetyltransferase [Streptomyces antarcticus]|uniref:GNAT family N-acetyltransferase n=1 Tax=Streptomyces antarcticus TaxID=2996458 RepID=UPI00226E8E4A|nr:MULTISPECIES: GNAT family N-acetyltransferase [unclassified Streptomyces]MCY0942413.1 GNAT family N-acetyltransferase [Streptomyces sp. H34-AA3]MCZ4080590.1 GNAT family N-acetyltransferase [Streptomyces sp. H34-S5]
MVTLRRLTPDDAPTVARIYSGGSVRFTHGEDYRMTVEDAAVRLKKIHDQDHAVPRSHWNLGITVAGDLIGVIKSRKHSPNLATLSYILREDTWGHGHATDAVRQFVPLVFAEAAVAGLEAKHHPDNPASGRVLAKAGFTRLGVHEGYTEYRISLPSP